MQRLTPNELSGLKLTKAPYGASCSISDSCLRKGYLCNCLYLLELTILVELCIGLLIKRSHLVGRVYAEYGGVFQYVGMGCTDLYDG